MPVGSGEATDTTHRLDVDERLEQRPVLRCVRQEATPVVRTPALRGARAGYWTRVPDRTPSGGRPVP